MHCILETFTLQIKASKIIYIYISISCYIISFVFENSNLNFFEFDLSQNLKRENIKQNNQKKEE